LRYSKYFLPTLREVPADAEVVSHILMIRAGLTRKLTAGIYTYLPYGFAAFKKVERIIREEMNRAGAIEMFMPEVQPAEVWIESGRWEFYGKELLRFKDRHDHDYCLAPTNEEVITDICRKEIRSYRDMPVNLYHFQQKFRDEVRPRFGVMRGRQFCMKDAYSFDVDENASAVSYRLMYEAYCAAFSRLGLEYKAVEADSGSIGGSFSHEFMVLAETGEDAVVSCTACDFGANIERAQVLQASPPAQADPPRPLEKIPTPGVKTIADLAAFTGRDVREMAKFVLFVTDKGPVAAFVRGDHEVNPVKVQRAVGAEMIDLAPAEEVLRLCQAPPGSCGPMGLDPSVKVLADLSLQPVTNWLSGANQADHHYVNLNPGRDFPAPRYLDLRLIQAGDPCPRCGAGVVFMRGIEVGHVFRLGTKYAQAMNATYLDQEGQSRLVVMGCYGIGVDRTLAAAIEQNHDRDGIIFPVPIAPFPAAVVPAGTEPAIAAKAEEIHDELCDLGVATLLDDRDLRPGVKFKDVDLIGVPYRITVGRALAEGQVELKDRREAKPELVPAGEAARRAAELIKSRLT
jgi:prolyl-tRNA synthetase